MIVSREALGELVERLAALPASQRSSVPGIKPARADLILAGAIVVQGALLAGGFDGLEVTEAGLREGVFFERYCDRRLDDAAAVRRSAPHERAEPGGAVPARHAPTPSTSPRSRWRCSTSLRVCGLHEGERVERELLWAACMLHDIGMSVDYDDHHKHSRYLILNGGLPGYSPIEVAIVAQAARYHRKGMPDPGPLAALFGPGDAARLDRCAVLLRLAEDLERSRDQLVRGTRFRLTAASNGEAPAAEAHPAGASSAGEPAVTPPAGPGRGEVELRLIADGEPAVPRWAARPRERAVRARFPPRAARRRLSRTQSRAPLRAACLSCVAMRARARRSRTAAARSGRPGAAARPPRGPLRRR